MIDIQGFADMRDYISRRLSYARYCAAGVFSAVPLSNVAVLANGTVRAQVVIAAAETPMTVTRVELYNSDGQLWAHQDCSITINSGQRSILYWFDFKVEEG